MTDNRKPFSRPELSLYPLQASEYSGQAVKGSSFPIFLLRRGPALAVDAHGQKLLSGRADLITPDANGYVNIFFNTTK